MNSAQSILREPPTQRGLHASRAEAFAPLRAKLHLLCRAARPLSYGLLASLLIGGSAPKILLSQTTVGLTNPALPGSATGLTHLVGRVVDQAGRPRTNVEVQVKDPAGNLIKSFRTNELGRYCTADIPPGQYSLTHDPARTAYEGQTVVAFIPQEGLYVDWRVAVNSAIAIATPLGDSLDCEKFLAGENLLERIFGVIDGEPLAAGSVIGGLGSIVGVTTGALTTTVASPSQ